MNKIDEVKNTKPEHVWNQEDLKKDGDVRCSKCSIKISYYKNAIHVLFSWSKDEIEAEPFEAWKHKVESINRCPNS